ncbi:hypothetical protein Pan153_42900 [Gimesia panareensis]|uniref:Knr4/Smi1-like domain-containing protein n=1 Tax=Gimesia panareensis TaxID=2527978 RepID=A0A518FTF9_9PLAN|nr:hypothetical protein [Gimesia panareensis]QDV19624.1 hypothetical protein Pan153_42900 [Gimesia panareensis]
MQIEQSPFKNTVDQKEVPFAPDGRFDWLRSTPEHAEWAIGDRQQDALPAQLESLVASAREHAVTLPPAFLLFFSNPSLHKHLRSANGDYLSLAENLLPFENGYLARFLSDQQDGVHWYLFLNSDGSDSCVVSSFEYFDADDMDYEPEEISVNDFHYWSESFELFFSRYWIEHEVMFAQNEETPLPDVDQRILDLYTS